MPFSPRRLGQRDLVSTFSGNGQLEQLGTPSELYFQPKSAFVAGFFGEINRIPGTVRDDGVATPLGLFPAEGLADGTDVEVLVRPEALTLSSNGLGDAKALVSAARLLGRTTLVHLNALGEEGGQVHLHPLLESPCPDSGAQAA